MFLTTLFSLPADVYLVDVCLEKETLTLVIRSSQASAVCPACTHPSSRIRGRYTRTLADLLGRNGLQRNLMNDAEKMIVMYANQTLYNLSHGRMRLELKKDSQRAAPNKIDKALDLVVYDVATGNQAISVDMGKRQPEIPHCDKLGNGHR